MPREPWKISREMFLSEAETQKLLEFLRTREKQATDQAEAIAATTDRVIIETLLFSGLRNSEFCQLSVQDTPIGRTAPVLVVQDTPRQNRLVSIPLDLAELLKRFVRETRPQLLPPGVSSKDRDQPLIINERGNPYERTGLYRRVVRILTEAGLADRASVQLLRHTYGYLAYKRTGGNLLFVQRQLGHAHPMVTAVYAEFVDFPGDQLANQVAAAEPTVVTKKSRSRSSSR